MVRQVWTLEQAGRRHRVEADTGGWRPRLRWWVDDELVAERRSGDERVVLAAEGEGGGVGRVVVRLSGLGRPRRATWHAPGASTTLERGGTDLEPEAGSPAARHERLLREQPRRYALQRTAAAVVGVVAPLVLGLLALRFAVSLPWPDWSLPSVPWPSLPSVPLPSVPWPDWSLPDWEAPPWLRRLLDAARYVWPVALAYLLARHEIRRRRQQDDVREGRDRTHDRTRDRTHDREPGGGS